MARTREPWERLPGETPRQWAAFQLYLDAGLDRTIKGVADTLKRHSANIYEWAADNEWRNRARAWDDEVSRLALRRRLRDAADARVRMAQQGRAVASLGLRRLVGDAANGVRPARLSGRDAISAFRAGVAVERDALGMAQRVEMSGPDGAAVPVEVSGNVGFDWAAALGSRPAPKAEDDTPDDADG